MAFAGNCTSGKPLITLQIEKKYIKKAHDEKIIKPINIQNAILRDDGTVYVDSEPFTKDKQIGAGLFGIVNKYINKENGNAIAVKTLLSRNNVDIAAIRDLSSIEIDGFVCNKILDNTHIGMQLMDGDLNLISFDIMEEQTKQNIARDIIMAVFKMQHILFENNKLYADMKKANMLFKIINQTDTHYMISIFFTDIGGICVLNKKASVTYQYSTADSACYASSIIHNLGYLYLNITGNTVSLSELIASINTDMSMRPPNIRVFKNIYTMPIDENAFSEEMENKLKKCFDEDFTLYADMKTQESSNENIDNINTIFTILKIHNKIVSSDEYINHLQKTLDMANPHHKVIFESFNNILHHQLSPFPPYDFNYVIMAIFQRLNEIERVSIIKPPNIPELTSIINKYIATADKVRYIYREQIGDLNASKQYAFFTNYKQILQALLNVVNNSLNAVGGNCDGMCVIT